MQPLKNKSNRKKSMFEGLGECSGQWRSLPITHITDWVQLPEDGMQLHIDVIYGMHSLPSLCEKFKISLKISVW